MTFLARYGIPTLRHDNYMKRYDILWKSHAETREGMTFFDNVMLRVEGMTFFELVLQGKDGMTFPGNVVLKHTVWHNVMAAMFDMTFSDNVVLESKVRHSLIMSCPLIQFGSTHAASVIRKFINFHPLASSLEMLLVPHSL